MRKLSEVKIEAMFKMRELGITVEEISVLLKVSRHTVYDYTVPGRRERKNKRLRDFYRKTTLCVTTNGKIVRLSHLDKRPHPKGCELCDEEGLLYYHYWDSTHPEVGIWLCRECRKVAGFVDSKSDYRKIILRYLALKPRIQSAIFREQKYAKVS